MPQERRRSLVKITSRITFEAAIWVAFEPYATKLIDDERTRHRSRLEHGPQGEDVPSVLNRAVRGGDLLLHRIFHSYREVTTSFDTLSNIPFYMRHFPSSISRSVTRPVWLRYHIENYLNEIYIFQNRVEAFFKLLRRGYRKQEYSSELNKRCDLLEKALKEGFSGVVTIRGKHVHERRFEDTTLATLDAIEFLAKFGKKSARERWHWFQEIRAEKISWMVNNNAAIRKWLDEVGRVLGKWLFMEDGKFRFPSPPEISATAPTVIAI